MSTFTSVSLSTNGTKVTYSPRQLLNGVGLLATAGPNGSLLGQNTLTMSNRMTPSKRQKSRVKVAVPHVVMDVVNGANIPRVVGNSYINVEIDMDPACTSTLAENLFETLGDLADPTQTALKAVLIGRQNVFG